MSLTCRRADLVSLHCNSQYEVQRDIYAKEGGQCKHKKKKVNILDNKQCGTFLTKRNAFTNSHTKRPERPQKIAKVYDKIITIVKRSPFKIKVKNT